MQRVNEEDPILDIAGHLYADIETETIKRPIEIGGDLKAGATLTMKGASKALGDILIVGALAGTIDFPGQAPGEEPIYLADIVVASIASTGKILVADDMAGSIDCTGTMAGLINIDGDLDKTGSTLGIEIATTGLTGQIIINSANDGGAWTDDVRVGATDLDPKGAYTQINLGGGTVGLVPFDCYKYGSTPAYTSSTRPEMSGDFSVTIRHYGPVKWTSGMPFLIEYCVNASCGTWADRSSFFEATLSADGRDIVITPVGDGTLLGEYRISPITTGNAALKCDDTTATDPLVASYRYDVKYNG